VLEPAWQSPSPRRAHPSAIGDVSTWKNKASSAEPARGGPSLGSSRLALEIISSSEEDAMAFGYYRRRPLVVRLQRALWRLLKICLAAFAALGPAQPLHEPPPRAVAAQYQSAGAKRK
jgi:hypothetical protein